MLSSLLTQWKLFLASFTALVLTITPTPPQTATNATTAVNVQTTGTSRNWSGYSATSGTFTAVNGTWTIPGITSNGHTASDATWVGIGGIKSSDLIQAGTQAIIASSGQTSYLAFFELLPNGAQTIPVTVNSGDSISVAIMQTSTNQWQISFTDNTSGKSYQTTTPYTSSLSTSEWIEEAPSDGRSTLPLDMFGTIQFSNGSTEENGSTMNLSQAGAQAITMVNAANQPLATPSVLNSDGASFSVTRTSATSNSPIPQYDRNPTGFRRHGFGIGSYIPRRMMLFPTSVATPSARAWYRLPHIIHTTNRVFIRH